MAIPPTPSPTGQEHTDLLLTCTYLDAVLTGLCAAAVCRIAIQVGGTPGRRRDDHGA